LAHIIAAVQRAQNSRANIQRIGDKVSSVFVPVVIAVAIAAGLWWGLAPDSARHVHTWIGHFGWAGQPMPVSAAGFIIAAAVLIVACPCAMGLATPAAIMAGSNAAAERGILIRDGIALEKAGGVTAIIFDKTGTLTVGRPSVVKVWEAERPAFQGNIARAWLKPGAELTQSAINAVQLGAALAQYSTHPLSKAIASLDSLHLEILEWEEVHGAGVRGKIRAANAESQTSKSQNLSAEPGITATVHNGEPTPIARMGSLRWLRESGVDLSSGEAFIKEWASQSASIVGVAVENTLLGLFAVKDTLKPGSQNVVQTLQRQGLKVFLVTGDSLLTAASMAAQAGIQPENVFAEVRPELKAEFVKQLQSKGERVAFVGDGINDAPALEQADLGIAVARATDIAREAADIILLNSEIEAVPESLGLARATLRTIKQNLFWAFFYNVLGIPLAALGFMSPIVCAAAMGLSDIVVIGNALRLRHWKM
jgi:Cu+-exporting ATPase